MASTPLCTRDILLRGAAHRLRPMPPCPVSRHLKCGSVRCSFLSPPQQSGFRTTRRSASVALILVHFFSAHRADAGSPFDKYVKRRQLDPLEAYIPVVLLTQEQFKDLEKSFDLEQPQLSRSLLRSGPAASLRVNIRAVAQYAANDGKGQAASDAVDQCLRALEDLDSLLLHASRNDSSASVESMKSKISIALGALDSLLQTVPSPVLDKGKEIADAYRIPVDQKEQGKPGDVDAELKALGVLL